jgi:hypothetical protein
VLSEEDGNNSRPVMAAINVPPKPPALFLRRPDPTGAPAKMVVRLREELLVLCQGYAAKSVRSS